MKVTRKYPIVVVKEKKQLREKVERGLRDLKSKRVLSQKEVERRMTKWLGK